MAITCTRALEKDLGYVCRLQEMPTKEMNDHTLSYKEIMLKTDVRKGSAPEIIDREKLAFCCVIPAWFFGCYFKNSSENKIALPQQLAL